MRAGRERRTPFLGTREYLTEQHGREAEHAKQEQRGGAPVS